jgi:hypothetical protein
MSFLCSTLAYIACLCLTDLITFSSIKRSSCISDFSLVNCYVLQEELHDTSGQLHKTFERNDELGLSSCNC